MSEWINWLDNPPIAAGYYIVGCRGHVGYARYMPKKKTWVFSNAKLAFHITHYMCLPGYPLGD